MNRRRGFTLIEVVVTLAIVGLLASIAAPFTETVVRRGKEQELRQALYQLHDALDAYKRAADAGQIDKPADSSGYPRDLQVLVEGMPNLRSGGGERVYFLRRIPREHWGLRAYASSAADPQPGKDVFDVYSRASGRGLNGVAYREW